MASDPLAELISLAGAVGTAHEALRARAREIGRAAGIEVVDVRPGGSGEWDIRVRALAEPESFPAAPAPAAEPRHAGDGPRLWSVRPRPFVSPVRGIPPFDGDGSDDVLGFIAASDPAARVPGRGGPTPGATVRVLSTAERIRMLASTVAGDALLSLQHRRLLGDEEAVTNALLHARDHYVAEVGRSGAEAGDRDFPAEFDRVAAELRHLLPIAC